MNDKRFVSDETRCKVLKLAAEILRMHGSVVGDRCCQDWSGEVDSAPNLVLSKDELDDISFNFELDNSDGDDYDSENSGMHDEMCASFSLAVVLDDMADSLVNRIHT